MKLRNTYFVFVSLFFLISYRFTQAQVNTLWTKTFGGVGNDVGKAVQQTTDGGYIITGYTESFGAGGHDVWLIKTDDAGDTLWTRTFGGNYDDYGHSVQQTVDGGYIIAGSTKSFGSGDSDVWLIKTNDTGDTLWTKTFGGIANDEGNSVQQTPDEGYIICGSISYSVNPPGPNDVWLIKTDSSGDTLWTKIFGDINGDIGNSVEQTTDGGYIITGNSAPYGSPYTDVLLIKTNSSGEKLWSKIFDIGTYSFGESVQQTPDGGYIIVGYTVYNLNVLFLIKTDDNGNKVWEKLIGSTGSGGYSVQLTRDEGYIITGRTYNNISNDVWLIKTDDTGNTLWEKTFGLYTGNDFGYSVQQTIDDGFIIAGYTESYDVGGGDVWLIKTSPDVSEVGSDTGSIPLDFSLSQNYPNPFNPVTTITYQIPQTEFVTLKVFDILGREVATLVNEDKPSGSYEVQFTGSELTSGIYFYQLKAGEYSETKKMILLK